MALKILTAVEACREVSKKAKKLVLRIFRRRRVILKSVYNFSTEFGLRIYIYFEKQSKYRSYDVYSLYDPMHLAIVSYSSIFYIYY